MQLLRAWHLRKPGHGRSRARPRDQRPTGAGATSVSCLGALAGSSVHEVFDQIFSKGSSPRTLIVEMMSIRRPEEGNLFRRSKEIVFASKNGSPCWSHGSLFATTPRACSHAKTPPSPGRREGLPGRASPGRPDGRVGVRRIVGTRDGRFDVNQTRPSKPNLHLDRASIFPFFGPDLFQPPS